MASSQSPNRVFFSNLDRSANDTTTDFTISFDTPITNAYNYEVVSASFPNLLKPFASYETILYFYHEDSNSGNIAIGVPLSTTEVGGTGETSPPAARAIYIDKRYFADGTELAAYLTDWLVSLNTSWPTQASGLQPFFFTGDDFIGGTRTFFPDMASTGVTFSALAFAFDDLTAGGTLKLDFQDTTPNVVRLASVLDVGSLENGTQLPSRLGFKLGFTDLFNEAMNSVLTLTNANNQLKFEALFADGSGSQLIVTIPPNEYNLVGFITAVNTAIQDANAPSPNSSKYAGIVASLTGGTTLVITFPTPAGALITDYRTTFLSQSLATICGFTALSTTTGAGGTLTAPSIIVVGGGLPSPAAHIATDTINLTRTSSVFMASSLSSGESMTSQGRKDVLFAIPVTAGIGAVQQYQSSLSGIVINRPPNAIRNVRLTMLDDLFQILEPLPTNASVNVEVHFAYREDAKASQLDFRTTNLYA